MRIKHLCILFFILLSSCCHAQISFSDTIKEYNKQRIIINAKGMEVLGGVGIANMAIGGIGYFAAKNDEWKYFHGMNAAFGLVNTGVATYGLLRARKQSAAHIGMQEAYNKYKRDKRILLINMGFDAAYIGAGFYLMEYSKTDHNNPQQYRGYGRSLMIQGACLLLFDNVLLLAHGKYSGPWATIIDEMRFTGNGISYVHTF